jgi:elongation factor Ts
MEVNCETDFVARDASFQRFASEAAALDLARAPAGYSRCPDAASALPPEDSLEDLRKDLVAKIGENIAVRRFEPRPPPASSAPTCTVPASVCWWMSWAAMTNCAATWQCMLPPASPQCVSTEDVPAEALERERRILTEQARARRASRPEIVGKMVEGRLRKFFNEITLLGQPFVKDPDTSVGNLVQARRRRSSLRAPGGGRGHRKEGGQLRRRSARATRSPCLTTDGTG